MARKRTRLTVFSRMTKYDSVVGERRRSRLVAQKAYRFPVFSRLSCTFVFCFALSDSYDGNSGKKCFTRESFETLYLNAGA